MIQIMLEGAEAQVLQGVSPETGQPQYALTLTDPASGIVVMSVMDMTSATKIGNALSGRAIVHPAGVPPVPPTSPKPAPPDRG